MEFTPREGRIRIKGVLNYEVFKNLNEENKKKSVEFKVKDLFRKANKNDDSPLLKINDNNTHNVLATFKVVDFLLNEKGTLEASTKCKKVEDGIDVIVESVEYIENK